MNMIRTMMLLAVVLLVFAGCRDAAEFFGYVGSPVSDDGWSHDYNATTHDTWEAFRAVVRDNGEITSENQDEMSLTGIYKPHDSSESDGIHLRGRVYDKSSPDDLRSRLIIYCWYNRAANDRGRQHLARDYCNTVFRVLRKARGEGVDDEPRVDTTSEPAVQEDEAVAYFQVTRQQAFEAAREVLTEFGSVEQSEPDQGFLRGSKVNPLEKQAQEVRVSVYDRTEGDNLRAKVSVRVRSADDKPLQEVAQAYISEIRGRLLKQAGTQE